MNMGAPPKNGVAAFPGGYRDNNGLIRGQRRHQRSKDGGCHAGHIPKADKNAAPVGRDGTSPCPERTAQSIGKIRGMHEGSRGFVQRRPDRIGCIAGDNNQWQPCGDDRGSCMRNERPTVEIRDELVGATHPG